MARGKQPARLFNDRMAKFRKVASLFLLFFIAFGLVFNSALAWPERVSAAERQHDPAFSKAMLHVENGLKALQNETVVIMYGGGSTHQVDPLKLGEDINTALNGKAEAEKVKKLEYATYWLVNTINDKYRGYLEQVKSMYAANDISNVKDALKEISSQNSSGSERYRLEINKHLYAVYVLQKYWYKYITSTDNINLETKNVNVNNGYKINRPVNLISYVSGTNTDLAIPYTSIERFWEDFNSLEQWLNDNIRKGLLGEDSAEIKDGLTVQDVNASFVKLLNNYWQDEPDPEECGSYTTWSYVRHMIGAMMCGLATSVRDFATSVLTSSVNLLFAAANISGEGSDVGGIFGFLMIDRKGSIQENLVTLNSPTGIVVREAYSRILSILGYILIVMLLVVALANILQIQINNYAIKKIVPGLIIGYLVAHGGMFLMRGGIELTGALSSAFISNQDLKDESKKTTKSEFASTFISLSRANQPGEKFVEDDNKTVRTYLVIKQLVLNVFVIAAAVMIFILAFLFVIRSYVLYFAVALAPLALFSAFVPPLQTIWKRWWKTVSGWLFMPIVATFWIWLAFKWITATNAANSGATGYFMGYAFSMVILYLAIKTPFSMAGEAKMALDKWANFGKKNWGTRAVVAGAVGAGAFAANNTGIGAAYRAGLKFQENLEKYGKESKENFIHGNVDQSFLTGISKGMDKRDNAKLKELGDQEKALKEKEKNARETHANDKDKLEEELKKIEKEREMIKGEKNRINSKGRQVKKQLLKGFGVGDYLDIAASAVKKAASIKEESRKTEQALFDAKGGELLHKNKDSVFLRKFAEMEAISEKNKEAASALNEILTKEVQARRNRLQEEDAYFTELRDRKTAAIHKAEQAETDRDLRYNAHLENERKDILDLSMKSKALVEARQKDEARVINKRSAEQERVFSILESIRGLNEEIDILQRKREAGEAINEEDLRRKARLLQDNTKQLNNIAQANEAGDNRQKFESLVSAYSGVLDAVGNFSGNNFRSAKTTYNETLSREKQEAGGDLIYSAVRKRVRNFANSYISDNATFYEENNLFRGEVFEGPKAGKVLAYFHSGRTALLNDDEIQSLNAIQKGLRQGTLAGPDTERWAELETQLRDTSFTPQYITDLESKQAKAAADGAVEEAARLQEEINRERETIRIARENLDRVDPGGEFAKGLSRITKLNSQREKQSEANRLDNQINMTAFADKRVTKSPNAMLGANDIEPLRNPGDDTAGITTTPSSPSTPPATPLPPTPPSS